MEKGRERWKEEDHRQREKKRCEHAHWHAQQGGKPSLSQVHKLLKSRRVGVLVVAQWVKSPTSIH